MPPPRTARAAVLPAALVVSLLAAGHGWSQKPKAAAPNGVDDRLKPGPRAKRPALPPSKLPLEVIKGERIAFVGGSTAERMSQFGTFETLLHSRFPDKELVVRNFGYPGDEVGLRQRSADYTKLDDPLYAFGPDTFLCFFGYNESFKGPAGVDKFQADYEKFLDEYARKYPRDDAGSKPRFVIVSPLAFENTGEKFLPDGATENASLKLYAAAAKAVAVKRGLAFVDLFAPTEKLFAEQPGAQFTVNGCHVNEAGDRAVGVMLDTALFGPPTPAKFGTSDFEKLRAAVNDKSWVHEQDYRMVNGWYVYGGRRTYDTETFPREYAKLRNMAAVRDRYVWALAQGKPVPPKPDDAGTGDLITPPTRFGISKYSENAEGGPQILPPDEQIKRCTTAPGTELKLFADEGRFPDLAKPVQINFDNKGRLWVACMPSYPLWKPGDPRVSDKLVILEDTDGDGKADKSTVFYDKLHCPTGFAFYNGGVLVMDQPRILWLKDTDGDDKADLAVTVFDGWATDDTHHRGGWEWDPTGRLHILEGIATSTSLETPWGPHHSLGAGGCYVVDTRAWAVRQFALPGMANMWCYTFDEWGQGVVGDGTTANQTWDTPLSGAQYGGRKGVNFILPNGVRPNLGNEWLVSRNLPDDLQRQFTYACVIEMNGLTRYQVADDGAGYKGTRLRDLNPPAGAKKAVYADLVRSTDKHFRPADPQIGPDGALWFADWANPLIGHMQYSQRDPNRDHTHGRIYRLVGTGRPLVKPVTQAGKPVAEVLEQFREYEWRTRYRARVELQHNRPTAEVLPAVAAWLAKLDPADPEYDRLRCEALWVQAGHHAVNPELLKAVLAAKTPNARAAAARVAADERNFVPGAFDLLTAAAKDDNLRVRCEAVRGLSFYPTLAAAEAVLAAVAKGADYWLSYTAEAALGANEAVWRPTYFTGKLGQGSPAGKKLLDSVVASAKVGGAATPLLQTLLSAEPKSTEERNKAMTALSMMTGNPSNGRGVFQRSCIACHKVGTGEGADFGPNLADVAKRMPKHKLVESVIDPNAEVDQKYLSTKIDTADGKTVTGLVVAETAKEITIFDGKDKKTVAKDDIDKRTVLKQSSMPEGLAGTMAPSEFLDLIAYLNTLK